MKRTRFMTIHIEKTGDPKEPFDPTEDINSVLKRGPYAAGVMLLTDKKVHTTVSFSASWFEVRYRETLFRYLRHVLWIFARACRQIIWNLYWKVATSGIDRQNK